MAGMKAHLTVTGDFRMLTLAETNKGKKAVTAAMRQTAGTLKSQWRANVTAALGTKLGNSVRSEGYPKGGKNSLNAAALVWTKAPETIHGHETGALIRTNDGEWLTIPLPAAGKGKGGARITPLEWERKTGRGLTFVYGGGRRAMLVDSGVYTDRRVSDQMSWKNSAKKSIKRKVPPIIFLLVPQVKLRRATTLKEIGQQIAAGVPSLIVRNWS